MGDRYKSTEHFSKFYFNLVQQDKSVTELSSYNDYLSYEKNTEKKINRLEQDLLILSSKNISLGSFISSHFMFPSKTWAIWFCLVLYLSIYLSSRYFWKVLGISFLFHTTFLFFYLYFLGSESMPFVSTLHLISLFLGHSCRLNKRIPLKRKNIILFMILSAFIMHLIFSMRFAKESFSLWVELVYFCAGFIISKIFDHDKNRRVRRISDQEYNHWHTLVRQGLSDELIIFYLELNKKYPLNSYFEKQLVHYFFKGDRRTEVINYWNVLERQFIHFGHTLIKANDIELLIKLLRLFPMTISFSKVFSRDSKERIVFIYERAKSDQDYTLMLKTLECAYILEAKMCFIQEDFLLMNEELKSSLRKFVLNSINTKFQEDTMAFFATLN